MKNKFVENIMWFILSQSFYKSLGGFLNPFFDRLGGLFEKKVLLLIAFCVGGG